MSSISAWLKHKFDKSPQSILDEMRVVSGWLKCKFDRSAHADQFVKYRALMLFMKSCSMSANIICTNLGGPLRDNNNHNNINAFQLMMS